MTTIKKNSPLTNEDLQTFLDRIEFKLPDGFIAFYRKSNGAELHHKDGYIILWALTEMIELNEAYNVHEFAPEFFIFGSNGGDVAYCIEKKSGYIYDMPFIGMSYKEAVFRFKTFTELLELT